MKGHHGGFRKRCRYVFRHHAGSVSVGLIILSMMLSMIKPTEQRIYLHPDTKSIRQQASGVGPKSREVLEQHIEIHLDAGSIEPAKTEWTSSVILAPKQDGTMRFCVNFVRLNSAPIVYIYPLPHMMDCIIILEDAKIFSDRDALWGYW